MKPKLVITQTITILALLLLSVTNYSNAAPKGDGFFINGVYEVLKEQPTTGTNKQHYKQCSRQ